MPNPGPDPEKTPGADPESASRLDPEKTPRPDPRQGVFETLLVAGGRPVELESHLARMATSVGELFGAELGADAPDLVLGAAEGLGVGRVRLTAVSCEGGIALDAHGEAIEAASAFALAAHAVALRSLVVPGGLGPHKWVDRSLLERAEAEMSEGDRATPTAGEPPTVPSAVGGGPWPSAVGVSAVDGGGSVAGGPSTAPGQAPATAGGPSTAPGQAPATAGGPSTAPVPLLLDRDGTVLEASRANVFAVRDGALVTPPTDGRILPGIARAALIDVAREAGREVREEPLTVAELAAADGVFLTGSVRGVQPAASLDGSELNATDATALLAAALRRRWLKR